MIMQKTGARDPGKRGSRVLFFQKADIEPDAVDGTGYHDQKEKHGEYGPGFSSDDQQCDKQEYKGSDQEEAYPCDKPLSAGI